MLKVDQEYSVGSKSTVKILSINKKLLEIQDVSFVRVLFYTKPHVFYYNNNGQIYSQFIEGNSIISYYKWYEILEKIKNTEWIKNE